MPDKEQSPSERIAEESRKLTERKVAPLRAAVERRLAEKVAARPTPDLGNDDELPPLLYLEADQDDVPARLRPQLKAAADRLEALHAEREKLRERMRLIEFDATNKNSAPSARLQRIADYARAALSGKGSPDAP
jgi:hypothetical protein